MSKRTRREMTPADKGQHGDPLPEPERDGDGALTPDELLGRAATEGKPAGYMPAGVPSPGPITTGPIQHPKVCADCRRSLPVNAVTCNTCAPGLKPSQLGGTNSIDRTMRNDASVPRAYSYTQPYVRAR